VTGGVRDDELSLGSGEITVGDVDGYALFSFGSKAIRKQGQVDVLVPSFLTASFNGFKLIFEDCFGVMEEPTDQGALSIVHASRGSEAEQIHIQVIVFFSHRKYYVVFRSSLVSFDLPWPPLTGGHLPSIPFR